MLIDNKWMQDNICIYGFNPVPTDSTRPTDASQFPRYKLAEGESGPVRMEIPICNRFAISVGIVQDPERDLWFSIEGTYGDTPIQLYGKRLYYKTPQVLVGCTPSKYNEFVQHENETPLTIKVTVWDRNATEDSDDENPTTSILPESTAITPNYDEVIDETERVTAPVRVITHTDATWTQLHQATAHFTLSDTGTSDRRRLLAQIR